MTGDMGSRAPAPEERRLIERSTAAFEAAVEADTGAEQVEKLRQAQEAARASALARAYNGLQRLVGVIACGLPPVVAIGHVALGGDGVESSISAYYYTGMGNVFVGALCALGVFWFSYQHDPLPGYRHDNRVSYGAGAAVIGVALLPTAEHEAEVGTAEWYVSTGHLLCACALFVLLAYVSLTLFTKSGDGPVTEGKRRRNAVFRACGWTIVAVIALVVASNVVQPPDSWNALFWLESVGVIAFGLSWLVKSGVVRFLADVTSPALPPEIPPDLAVAPGA